LGASSEAISAMNLQSVRPRRWPSIDVATISIITNLFCLKGYVMAGSFTVSNPEASGYWRQVALLCAAGLLLSFVGLLYAAIALWKRARLLRDERAI
jgi:hypothetical protein